MKKISIEVVSDVVCPWCYIGKRRFEKAIHDLRSDFAFEINYLPFELNPGIPESGVNQREFLVEKFGGEERYDQVTGNVAAIAAEEGLLFDFKKQKTVPNTRKAHVLIQFASNQGKQAEMVELLFSAYFTEGIDLSDDRNLIQLAAGAGLPEELLESVLSDVDSMQQMALAEQKLYKLGITGVPFYIINKKYGISGAQSPETFIKAFLDIGKEISPEKDRVNV